LDNLYSYSDPKVKKVLEEFNLEVLEIPAHLSHLTQPLDCGTNLNIKRELKRGHKTTHSLSKRSKRIYNIIRAHEKNTGFLQNLSAFENAGFIIELNKVQKVTFNVDKILLKQLAPGASADSNVISNQAPKPKRIAVPHFLTKNQKISKTTKTIIVQNGTKLTFKYSRTSPRSKN